jgi:hypothetical protein
MSGSRIKLSVAWPLVLVGLAAPALCQGRDRPWLEIEGGAVWQSRNDIRIPNETGTEFSLVDVVGQGPYGVLRAELNLDVAERHGFRLVFAPLSIEDDGQLAEPVSFAGETFAPDTATDAVFKFSSYRLTYRFRFHDGKTWRFKVGLTGFVRDARVALTQGERFAEDTNVGFVPLLHVDGEARLSERLRLRLDFDGLAASQGRAFDVAAKLGYAVSDRLELTLGYRTIEGGADVEDVYSFAWLHFAVASLRVRF